MLLYYYFTRLGDIMVSVLAVRLNLLGFKLFPSYGFLRAMNIRRTPSFRWEVKPEAPCLEISSPGSPDFLLDDSPDRISRQLWWTNQEFPLSISFHHGSPCSFITWGMNSGPVV
jgi:hypothetical protein